MNTRFDWWLDELKAKGDYYHVTHKGETILVLAETNEQILEAVRRAGRDTRTELKDLLIEKLPHDAEIAPGLAFAPPIPDNFLPDME